VTGLEMPVFPKRRFQDGVAAADIRRSILPGTEQMYRQRFLAMYAG
jgi:asparagine synthase (glutamine-hydrolysing)